MMKTACVIFAALFFVQCACRSVKEISNNTLPNVVFILVDDLGWSDAGYMGSTYYETPNIDKLASQSLRFSQAYAGAANCAPSRACLLSGMQSPRTGVYTVSPSTRGNKKTRKIIPIKNTKFLADSVYTMAEMFKAAGYTTGHFGKWHLGNDPTTQGFDVNVGGAAYGHPKSYFAPYGKPNIPALEGEYLPDRLTSEAINFIENNKKNPFFLYFPFYSVHTPIQAKEALAEKYKQKVPSNVHFNAEYAAMIESLDQNIGRLLNKLDELKLENTIVVFTSDNGGIYKISRQWPLRAGKGAYYEGGVRVPLAIRWPNRIAPGTTDAVVSNLDFYPTFKDIIGAKIKNNQPQDGISLANFMLKADSLPQRPIFFHFPIYLQGYDRRSGVNRDPLFRTRPGTSLRYGNWKLIYYYEDQAVELFNLLDDPGEQKNLATEFPEKVDELKQRMDNWLKQTHAPIPAELNPAYDAAFEKKRMSELM